MSNLQLFIRSTSFVLSVLGCAASFWCLPFAAAFAADSEGHSLSRRKFDVSGRSNAIDPGALRSSECASTKSHESLKPNDVANYVSAFISTLSGVQHVRISQAEDKSINFELTKKMANEIAVSYKSRSIQIKTIRLDTNVKFRASRMPIGLGVLLDDADGIEVIASLNGSSTNAVIPMKKASLHRDEAGVLTLKAEIPDASVKRIAISVPLVPLRAPMHELPPEPPIGRQPAAAGEVDVPVVPASYSGIAEPAIVP